MHTDIVASQTTHAPREGLYTDLMEHAKSQPNDELFAQIISSQLGGASALPPCLGLEGNRLRGRELTLPQYDTLANGQAARHEQSTRKGK